MSKYYILFVIFALLSINTSCKINKISTTGPILPTIQKSLIKQKAMVASARIESSIIATKIMKAGGNAIDAAIATQFALAVAYPVAGNIGGGGFMIVRMNDGEINALDFREKAPMSATKDMYLDKNGNALSDKSRYGSLAVGVPGAVSGMVSAYHKYSRLKDWKALLQPAIDLAHNGIVITQMQADLFNKYHSNFKTYNTVDNVFTSTKQWKKGDILIQKDLAKTLELIRDHGRKGFYEGETAHKIVAEMKRSKGLITLEDLRLYKAQWRLPITTDYRGYKIISMPPPSSGGIALAQLLEMIEPFDLKKLGYHTPACIHLMSEAERRVYADRAQHLGDTDFYPVPTSSLLDPTYLTDRMKTFDPNRATISNTINAGEFIESDQTTHYSIVDPYGNAISITTTLNGHYGSKLVVGEAGFFLNNEMDDFSAKPGTPNMFGLLGAEANKIEPQKRMLSSMTPTIVEKDGTLKLTLGTPGGATIITSVFQTIINIIDFNMTAAEAVQSSRFHHQWKPDQISVEEGKFSSITIAQLKNMGHSINNKTSIGRVEAILIQEDGNIEGAADPRGDDDVRGF